MTTAVKMTVTMTVTMTVISRASTLGLPNE